MKYRTLGKTGIKVAEVGMGTWQLAGDPGTWGLSQTDIDESRRALSKYVELGGNFIDTAWIYGYYDAKPTLHPSENLIGEFLKKTGLRNKVTIATKVPPKNMTWPAHRGVNVEEVFPYEWVVSCVNDSLISLGVDQIDLMQFHVWQDDFVSQSDGWQEALHETLESGKVRYWGISINDYQPTNCFKAIDTGLISTIQFIFNIFHQRPSDKLLAYAKTKDIGLIARVPLDEGGLTGKMKPGYTFAQEDFRSWYFGKDRLNELEQRVEKIWDLGKVEASSMPDLALRWLLSHREISTVIPGIRKVNYAEQNTAVSDGRLLSGALMEKLAGCSWERNFYANPFEVNGGGWVDPALSPTFME